MSNCDKHTTFLVEKSVYTLPRYIHTKTKKYDVYKQTQYKKKKPKKKSETSTFVIGTHYGLLGAQTLEKILAFFIHIFTHICYYYYCLNAIVYWRKKNIFPNNLVG